VAAKAIADGLFEGSVVPNLGNESWRQMLTYAREFAMEAFPDTEVPPLANADVCVLCHQPLPDEAKRRLLKFDEYLAGKVNEDAEIARNAFVATARRFTQFTCDAPEALVKKVESFIDGSSERQALAVRLGAFFNAARARSKVVVRAIENQNDEGLDALPALDSELVASLDAELANLMLLASTYQPTTEQTKEQVADAKRVEELEACKKFSSDVETFVERLANLDLLAKTKLCIESCASGPITSYITRIRRQQLTPTLRDNFKAEVKAFGLEHLPLISLSYQAAHPHAAAVFETLWSRGVDDAALAKALTQATVTYLPPNYFVGRSSRDDVDVEESREQQRQDFDRDIEQIRSGAHMGWLKHLGMIYFAHYGDVDRAATPRERLAAWLGEERTDAALEALMASLSRDDLPSYTDVMKLTAHHQHYDWWNALVAGLNERWAAGQGLSGLSDDFLQGMLAFDITNPVSRSQDGTEHWIVHPWRQALMERRPELVRDVYLAVVRLRLSRNEQFSDGLRELLVEAAFERYRVDIVLGLLREFPNASPFRLDELLAAAAKLPAGHEGFLKLARQVVSGAVLVDQRQRDLWLATAYVLAPASFEQDVQQRAVAHPDFIFDLRDKGGFGDDRQPSQPLAVLVAEFIARLAGSLFPETPHPSDGWNGNTNAWDASEYVRSLINVISASPSEAATNTLGRLNADPGLVSYRPHILHALANQRQRRRDAEYDRPNWPQTIAALRNAAPATVADLYALLVAHLGDLGKRIARANTDIFKQFWNLDSYARTMEPRPEEACRDNLVTLMRPSLLPLGITVEPEGHMVADKRADISVAMPSRKILCELKRDYHAEVWTAIEGQLERFYAHDPDAKGFGIYCVFWFGRKSPHAIPPHPKGSAAPKSPGEMEQMLKDLMPESMRSRLTVIVIDVSGEV
jgi:hypothetical protein